MTRSSPRCFAMKAAFESEVLVQELIGVVGKSTTHPPCHKIGLELLEVGMHRSFVLPHMARPRLPPMSRPTGALFKETRGTGQSTSVPLYFFSGARRRAFCAFGSTDQIRDPCGKTRPTSPFGPRPDDLTLRSRYLLRRTAP